MSQTRNWSIEYEIREDAESMFVPAELLPEARPGDLVEITSAEPPVTRRGTVAERTHDEACGQFVTVRFDEPSTASSPRPSASG